MSEHDHVAVRFRSDNAFGLFLKRCVDVLASSLLLIFFAPALVAIAIWVCLDSEGPALFAHERIGLGGRKFKCLKFRSMAVDAEVRLQRLLSSDEGLAKEWREAQKLRHDPRVTKAGRILRRTSLDELPQLINVLRGDMSLVGPRPIVDAEISRYGASIDEYHAMKPGITGLWQVSGRSDATYVERVRMDVQYVRTWSFFGDIVVLLKTIPAVFLRRGAM
ncbi:sugar transferase [Methylovirgula sp. 4M-Z18]|uniref:sugar transferase n=1 Tax=Methylovirgula sp. 4M-Z18 TaxID=2293567 RepID=UPI00131423B9|nr:sugar transferase [Methylovirgula sp. 4M-Z18]